MPSGFPFPLSYLYLQNSLCLCQHLAPPTLTPCKCDPWCVARWQFFQLFHFACSFFLISFSAFTMIYINYPSSFFILSDSLDGNDSCRCEYCWCSVALGYLFRIQIYSIRIRFGFVFFGWNKKRNARLNCVTRIEIQTHRPKRNHEKKIQNN